MSHMMLKIENKTVIASHTENVDAGHLLLSMRVASRLNNYGRDINFGEEEWIFEDGNEICKLPFEVIQNENSILAI